jgi:hypothetical protein
VALKTSTKQCPLTSQLIVNAVFSLGSAKTYNLGLGESSRVSFPFAHQEDGWLESNSVSAACILSRPFGGWFHSHGTL